NSPSFVSRFTCCPSFGRAPSATTTSELRSPAVSRARMASATLSKSNGISGIRMTSAPPAIPPCSAIQPACRPITSTTMARLWLVAVVCRRSSASITAATAESKPKVMAVASRSLSIVLGTPTQLIPASCNCNADVIEPSPPTMMSASACASFRTLRAFSITSAATTARSPAPILPTLPDESLAISKSIVATENYDDEVARKDCGVVAVLDHFGGAISRQDQAFTGTSGLAGFDAIDSVSAKQIVCCSKESMHLFASAVKGNFPLLLRNIKTKARLVHRVTSEPRKIDRSGIWHRPFLVIEPTGIDETRPVHPELFCQRIHLRDEPGGWRDL